MMEKFDVVILGSGPGGYPAAIRASDLGKKVAVVESKEIGGTCLNRGCIPTKTLLGSAEVYNLAKNSKTFGIRNENLSYDFDMIQERKNSIVTKLGSSIGFLLKARKIKIKKGKGRIVDEETVGIDKEKIKAKNVIIATGSEPAVIPGLNMDRMDVITSDEALNIKPPKDMLVVGTGAIGLEFAALFSSFGTKVTIVEMMNKILPGLKDEGITRILERNLRKKGVDIKTSVKIENIEKVNGKVFSTLSNGEKTENEKVLLCVGRKLNSDDIGLENIGVKTEKGRIIVDEEMRTNVPNMYAVGDVTGGAMLAHKAMREGIVASEVIAGLGTKIDYRIIPNVVFSNPEIAWVGVTEEEAKEKGMDTIIGGSPFVANGKALCNGKTEGKVKIVSDGERIIGGQIIGANASIMIMEIVLAMKKNASMKDLADLIHPHPTLSEIINEACRDGIGEGIHKMPKVF